MTRGTHLWDRQTDRQTDTCENITLRIFGNADGNDTNLKNCHSILFVPSARTRTYVHCCQALKIDNWITKGIQQNMVDIGDTELK